MVVEGSLQFSDVRGARRKGIDRKMMASISDFVGFKLQPNTPAKTTSGYYKIIISRRK